MLLLGFLFVLLLVLAVVIYRCPQYIGLFVFGTLAALLLSALFWRESLVVLSVLTMVYLGMAVVTGRVRGREAIMRAAVASLIFLFGSWIVIDIASGLFGLHGSEIFTGLRGLGGFFSGASFSSPAASMPDVRLHIPGKELMAAGSITLMVLSILLPRGPFAALSLTAGVLLFLLFGLPVFIVWVDAISGYRGSNPLRPALIVGLAGGVVGTFIKLYKRG